MIGAIQGLALWGILSAAEEAGRAARRDQALQVDAAARSLESALATRRNDLVLLTQTPPFRTALRDLGSTNPIARRWQRLEMESTLLLFLSGRPEIQWLSFQDGDHRPFLQVGRRDGAPVLLPLDPPLGSASEENLDSTLLFGSWPLGTEAGLGSLRAAVDLGSLVSERAALGGLRLRLESAAPPRSTLSSSVPPLENGSLLRLEGWSGASARALVCDETGVGAAASISALTTRYRRTLFVNLALMALAIVLGVLGVRQARARALADADRRQAESARREEVRRRELEAQLLHTERLASVGRLAAGMAHEINNPLAGITNYLSLLEDDLRSGRTEDAPQFIAQIRRGIERVTGVTRQVLHFSDPGKAPRLPVELCSVVEEAVRFVRGGRGVATTIEVHDRSAGALVLGHRVLLGQVVLNLLLNAAEIQENRGSIDVSLDGTENEVEIRVADRGPGVPIEWRDRIFEPFFSGRGSTGLGLSVCLGIVREHDGTLQVEERHGGGTTFRVRLPRARAPHSDHGRMDPA